MNASFVYGISCKRNLEDFSSGKGGNLLFFNGTSISRTQKQYAISLENII
jgi:hypothetical protein